MTAATAVREWTLLIPAPVPLWSANDSHDRGARATSVSRKAWRNAAYESAQKVWLPKGLSLVRFAITFHFQDRTKRDVLNYADTAKPLIDGYGPKFFQPPTKKRPAGASAPGWGLIPDDDPRYVESTSLAIGPLWREVLAGLDQRRALQLASEHGGVTVTITDLASERANQ